MTEQLKPCPFCGHTGLQFESGSTYRWGIASCDGCGATCGEVRRNYPDDGAWHAEAISEWNRRAQPAQAGQALSDEDVLRAAARTLDSEVVEVSPLSCIKDFARAIEAAVLAKRVPMQQAQIEHALRSEPMVDNEESFALGIRHAERHHGIAGKKGGAVLAKRVPQWLPIETAPKDGTNVLCWSAEFGARESRNITYTPGSPGHAEGKTDRWWEWIEPKKGWAFNWSPTHWMPLPPPPGIVGEKGGA